MRVFNKWSRKIMARISIRIDFAADRRIGPGKVKLLEHIDELGSIAAGGRALGMSYRRAWLLIDELNSMFGHPVVVSRAGGTKGGSASLTPLGLNIIAHYRAIERAAASAAYTHVKALDAELARSNRRKRP
jgi:molybdate transport system regulatory protein